ncbi:MAG TPA: hypothetical protein VF619_00510 [Allosphingosinicella sp.]|jgi:hypothetical protein
MMRLLTSSLLAFLLTASLFGATASAAPGSHYRAEAAAPPAASRLIVKQILWKCGPAGCVASRGNSRPAIDCSALAREVGALRSFSVDGREIGSEALEKCNAGAR